MNYLFETDVSCHRNVLCPLCDCPHTFESEDMPWRDSEIKIIECDNCNNKFNLEAYSSVSWITGCYNYPDVDMILKMIETVDPNETSILNEIDAREKVRTFILLTHL